MASISWSGRQLERTILSDERLTGEVVDWRGRFGWILPDRPVDHHQALRHGGKVYCAEEDLEKYVGVGSRVSFFAYVDNNGIGAMAVEPAVPPDDAAAQPAEASMVVATGGGCDWDSTSRPPPPDARDALERLEQVLRETLKPAVHGIRHLESGWTQEEIVECIVKHLHVAGQMPELLTLPWAQAVAHFIEYALRGYANTCCGQPWFFHLDLSEAVRNALWEILAASCSSPQPTFEEIEAVANSQYDEQMDAMLIDRALWEASAATFQDENVCTHVYRCLHTSHGVAVAEACDNQHMDEMQQAEVFIQRWMEESMGRAWQALEEGGGEQLQEQSITELFQRLLRPFGDDVPFSCVPFFLTKSIGHLPSDSPLVWKAAAQLIASWAAWQEPEPEAWEPEGTAIVAAC